MLQKYLNSILLNNIKRIMAKSHNLMSYNINQIVNNNIETKQFIPIYKTSYMPFFIGLSRLKTYQMTTLFCLVPTCIGLNMLGYLNFEEVIGASLVGFGLTTGLHFVSFFLSNNLVVFVYLSKDEQECRMSYISYWGKRKELYCNIKDIEPIRCSKFDFFNHKIVLKGNLNTFKITIRDATILNSAKFRQIFGSTII